METVADLCLGDALKLFRVLAHPLRLRILVELAREEECVCHFVALLDRPQPHISQQLAELRDAGLIEDQREGHRVFYHISDHRVISVLRAAGLTPGESRPRISGCLCPKCT